jgi:hypothetical protein
MEEINLDNLDMTPSSDFGGGIELLMNDKSGNKGSSDKSYISLEDDLKELDDLGSSNYNPPEIKPIRMNKDIFNESIGLGKDTISVDTFNQSKETGFRHLNDINIENEIKHVEVKTKEELAREKFELLRKLETLEDKGAKLSKHYTIESPLEEMRGELEFILAEKERKNSIALQGRVLTTIISGFEFLNNKFDPFDINLDGWSENITDNISEYDDVFGELHEKYKSKAKMAPEIKLLFQLATSGLMITMGNRFKSAIPGMDEIMRQNPDLMNHFTQAAVKSMEKTNPGMSNFMGTFGNNNVQQQSNRMPMPTMPQYSNQHTQQNSTQLPARHPQRQEMKGPEIKNINTVLSSLNTKINLEENNESTISMDDVDTFTGNNIPMISKKGRRRSDKSMALNI